MITIRIIVMQLAYPTLYQVSNFFDKQKGIDFSIPGLTSGTHWLKFGGDTRPIHMGGGRKDRLGGCP